MEKRFDKKPAPSYSDNRLKNRGLPEFVRFEICLNINKKEMSRHGTDL
jgi:hypothetical protein